MFERLFFVLLTFDEVQVLDLTVDVNLLIDFVAKEAENNEENTNETSQFGNQMCPSKSLKAAIYLVLGQVQPGFEQQRTTAMFLITEVSWPRYSHIPFMWVKINEELFDLLIKKPPSIKAEHVLPYMQKVENIFGCRELNVHYFIK